MNKICTSIEQSKKLIEILSFESADMHYNNASIKGINYVDEHRAELMKYNRAIKVLSKYTINPLFEVIPCWSLAALIEILPNKIRFDNETYYLNFNKDEVKYLGPITWDGQKCISSKANTIVDACYDMILKLNELKML